MDYFNCFNLPKNFEIDKKKLLKKYYSLQKKYHPDMNIQCSKKKKKENLKKSIYINQGYQILKKNFTRIQYLLKINGFDIKSKENNNILDKKFLYKQYKYYEKLDQLKKKKNQKKILNFTKKIQLLLNEYKKKIIIQLKKKSWKNAFIILQKIIFLKNFTKKMK
ncbi:Fe-S protein assembly co-chaperone HscB [Buchnera aphidicola]|uniref:Fe-S protein assembly co-chaperone HscB n=1 Tax=Buchnera aphidicola TaxID=9 RepID=UPI0034640154